MRPPSLITELRQSPLIQAIYRISREVDIAIYLVGGAVRDLLMGVLPEKDFDFAMQDKLDEVARRFAKTEEGHLIRWSSNPVNYRVIFYRNQNRLELDFTGFRGNDIYQDLANRDFTANAIALRVDEIYESETPPVYDPLNGIEDIRLRKLRATSSHTFHDDPLRMLRAVRLALAKAFVIDRQTREAILRQRALLYSVSPERVRSEFFKILHLPHAEESLRELDGVGLLSLLLPEVEQLKSQGVPVLRALSPWQQALDAVRWCEWALDNIAELWGTKRELITPHLAEEIEADVQRTSLLKLAALLCRGRESSYCTKAESDNSPGDEAKNESLGFIETLTNRLKLGKRANRTLRKIACCCPRIAHLLNLGEPRERVYFRYFWDAGPEGLDALVLFWADYLARHPDHFGGPRDVLLRGRLSKFALYYFEEFTRQFPKPLVSGNDVMEKFGVKEGKIIGRLLEAVARAESDGLLTSPAEALAYLETLIR